MADPLLDAMGRAICMAALAEDRCGELLECLFNGGSATVDARTGMLTLVGADTLAQLQPVQIDHLRVYCDVCGDFHTMSHPGRSQGVPDEH